jgi:hypothetical protein
MGLMQENKEKHENTNTSPDLRTDDSLAGESTNQKQVETNKVVCQNTILKLIFL